MAKKRKTTKKKARRRMGAMGRGGLKEAAMGIVGVTLGIIGGRLINTTMATTDGKLLGAGEAVAGGLLAMKAKNTLIKGIGGGLAGNGVLYALGAKGLNVLPATMGYGPGLQQHYRGMAGFRDVPAIGFPKPGNIGRPRMSNMDMARQARMYAGIYN